MSLPIQRAGNRHARFRHFLEVLQKELRLLALVALNLLQVRSLKERV